MHVYFIQAFGQRDLVRIKIGRAQSPEDRLRRLQTGSPVELKLLGKILCQSDEHAKKVEKLAHDIFHKQRRRGEWFHLSQKHLAQIKHLIMATAERQLEGEVTSVKIEKDKGLSVHERANRMLAPRPRF